MRIIMNLNLICVQSWTYLVWLDEINKYHTNETCKCLQIITKGNLKADLSPNFPITTKRCKRKTEYMTANCYCVLP